VKAGSSVSNLHRWNECNPREVEVVPDGTVLHRHCADCGRDFLTDMGSNTYAVFVSAISFYRLDDEVTGRWLREPCPGVRLTSDDRDRKRSSVEVRVADSNRVIGEGVPLNISAPASRSASQVTAAPMSERTEQLSE
jgi:hypothetical protein